MQHDDINHTDALLRCFYCDRITYDPTAVKVRLDNGLLSCAECSAHDADTKLVKVHDWDGGFLLVDINDIDAACDICGSGEYEPCVFKERPFPEAINVDLTF